VRETLVESVDISTEAAEFSTDPSRFFLSVFAEGESSGQL
jgi:hypothetical protein